jgi:hypothetical protein
MKHFFSRNHQPSSLQQAVSFALNTVGIHNIHSQQDTQKILLMIQERLQELQYVAPSTVKKPSNS